MHRRRREVALSIVVACLAGCAAPAPPRQRVGPQPGARGSDARPAPAAPADAAEPAPPPVRVETLLPHDTLLWLSVECGDRTREAFRRTALWAVCHEPAVGAFLARPAAQLARVARQFEQWGGFTFDGLQRAARGRVVVAVPDLSPRTGRFSMMVAAETAGAAEGEELAAGVCAARGIERLAFADIMASGWRAARLRLAGAEVLVALSQDRCIVLYDSLRGTFIDDVVDRLRSPSPTSLSTADGFRHVRRTLGSDDVAMLYLNARRLSECIVRDAGDGADRTHDRVRRLGLGGVASLSAALAVDPPGLAVRLYAHAPAPRAGVLAVMGDAPITDSTLRLAPDRTTMYSAARVRWPEVLALVRAVAAGTPSEPLLDESLKQVRESFGFDIERDLVANLDEEIVVAALPLDAVGSGALEIFSGVAIALRAKSPQALVGPVYALLGKMDGFVRQQIGRGTSETAFMGSRIRHVKLSIGPFLLEPSVATAKDRIVVAGSVAAAMEIIRKVNGEGHPFVRTPAVRDALAHVGGESCSSVSCSDPVESLAVGTASIGLVATVLMPAIAAAREASLRPQCAARLAQIGEACYRHAIDHDGAFPESLVALVPGLIAHRELLACPSSAAGGGYYYFTGLRTTDPSVWVLAIDAEGNHGPHGANVLFADGRVEWTTDVAGLSARLIRQLAAMRARLRTCERILQNPLLCAAPAADAPKASPPGGALHVGWGTFADWVDVDAVPAPPAFRRHLFPTVSTTTVDADGILVRSYSPVGFAASSLTVVGAVGIVAGAVVPYVVALRMEDNERRALASLAACLAAQAKFRATAHYAAGRCVYANAVDGRGFPDLYGLARGTDTLRLIDRALAEATSPATALDGYYFVDVAGMEHGAAYDSTFEFGLCAVPARYGRTGLRTFLTDISGTVYARDTGGTPVTRFPADTAAWERVP